MEVKPKGLELFIAFLTALKALKALDFLCFLCFLLLSSQGVAKPEVHVLHFPTRRAALGLGALAAGSAVAVEQTGPETTSQGRQVFTTHKTYVHHTLSYIYMLYMLVG